MHSFNIPFLYTVLSYQTDTYSNKFSWKSIEFFKKIAQHRHITAVKCLCSKLMHLLKVTRKRFDQLKKPNS